MKTTYTLLLFLLATVSILAQAPEKMSYQAVLRDASNTLLTNQEVGMQISILQTTITGTAVYIETQTATTNINGLVSLEIGTGSTSDNFATIDWSAGPYFIKSATDPSGGGSYTITGTSQIMSVPFALYAKTSGSSEANATNIISNTIDIETNTTAIIINTAKVGYTDTLVSDNTDVAANTAKVGITSDQASEITTNTAKTGVTSDQSTAITTNTAKVGYTDALVSGNTDVAANTAKVGITSDQASEITTNTAKTGVTSDQSTAITTNTAKVGYTDALVSANTDVAANTAKVGITSDQANAISANTTKTAAAGALTGTSLNATVVGSSLTSVGTLTGLTVTGTTETGLVKITGGTPGLGKVLTSDGAGIASWAAAAISVTKVDDEFTATTSQTAFTLSQAPSANSKVKMYVNGISISKTAYTYSSSGTSLTYDSANNGGYALTAGDRIQFDYFY
jgi:hypothetical protein